MRHVYECPMRWADVDSLGHVNNVVYVDYLQEARVDMMRAYGGPQRGPDIEDGLVVVRHEVTYLVPLVFEFKPVLIECWVTEIRAASFTMAYEVFHELDATDDGVGGRRVYLRATTVLSPFVFLAERPRRITDDERRSLEPFLEPVARTPVTRSEPVPRTKVGHYPVHVRFSDVDVFGHVNNVKYLEYLQEARILTTARVWRDLDLGGRRPHTVIAQTDVDYKIPILFRPEPYDLWTTISHIGTRSVTYAHEIRDGDRLLSRAQVVAVFFDLETGRSSEPPQVYREALVTAFA